MTVGERPVIVLRPQRLETADGFAALTRRVAAGIAIAAVADVTVLDMTLRSKACPVNAGTATAKYKGRCGFPLSFENAA